LSRFLSIGSPFWTFRLQPGGWQTPCLLTWVGLRGAISVALVQIMPEGPYNEALTAACYAVVIFSIVVQGLLTPRVMTALGFGTVRS
jgi:CPA1 family monovalent cation:H+ antiporter